MHLTDKTIWLTGASSGIGEALALALAAQGARLILTARSVDKLTAVQQRCDNPERHLVLPMDLSDASSVQGQVTAALPLLLQRFGGIDVLVNNAGIGQRATVQETTLAVDRQIMEVNYFSAVALTRAVLPHLLTRPEAMVVSVSSLMGKFATPRRSAYCASKHALVAFMDSLRAELHQRPVRVLTICPGYIRTPFSLSALTGDGQAQGRMDPGQQNGMAPERCAAGIVRAMVRNQAEAWIGGKEIFGVYLKHICPPLLRALVNRVRVT